jgi:Domain of unknown function (DUF4269)
LIDFTNPYYLKNGNAKQRKVYELINELDILNFLKRYNPIIVGTIPIEIDLPESDIDIICEVSDLNKFNELLTQEYSTFDSFSVKEKIIRNKTSVVLKLIYKGFTFEIFGQDTPTTEQYAYRHMIIQHKLLQSQPTSFRSKIIDLKTKGLTTEQAFGEVLKLKGDPYEELLKLE